MGEALIPHPNRVWSNQTGLGVSNLILILSLDGLGQGMEESERHDLATWL